jgi:hypothetical protein
MRRERDNQIIVISPEGARDIVRVPTVFEGARYPERIVLEGFNYGYVGAQNGTPVYRHECEIDPALREKS